MGLFAQLTISVFRISVHPPSLSSHVTHFSIYFIFSLSLSLFTLYLLYAILNFNWKIFFSPPALPLALFFRNLIISFLLRHFIHFIVIINFLFTQALFRKYTERSFFSGPGFIGCFCSVPFFYSI